MPPTTSFFDPNKPPPTLPLLVAQTDIFYHLRQPGTLLAQEVFHLETIPEPAGPPSRRLRTPKLYTRITRARAANQQRDGLIPKPEGEAGRPKSGGYTLKAALGWTDREYAEVKSFIQKKTVNTANTAKSYSQQSPGVIGIIVEAALKEYPVLANYKNHWPVVDFIKSVLKYEKRK